MPDNSSSAPASAATPAAPVDNTQPMAPDGPPPTPPPDNQPAPAVPPQPPGPDSSLTDPNAIIPQQPGPGAGAPLPQSQSPMAAAEEKQRKTNLRYQAIRIQAEKDIQVVRMREKADKEETMEDRRAAFREYYRLLFARMIKIDPTLTEKCNVMQAAYLRRLAQLRIEPTIPDYPPPTPEPIH